MTTTTCTTNVAEKLRRGAAHNDQVYMYIISDIVAGTVLASDKPLGNAVMNLGRGDNCYLRDSLSKALTCGVSTLLRAVFLAARNTAKIQTTRVLKYTPPP